MRTDGRMHGYFAVFFKGELLDALAPSRGLGVSCSLGSTALNFGAKKYFRVIANTVTPIMAAMESIRSRSHFVKYLVSLFFLSSSGVLILVL